MHFTPEQLKAVMTRVLSYGTAIAKLTPTKVDDDILGFLNQFVTEDWFVNLLYDFMTLFSDKKVSKDDFKKALVDHANNLE